MPCGITGGPNQESLLFEPVSLESLLFEPVSLESLLLEPVSLETNFFLSQSKKPPERERDRVLRFSLYLRVCIGCWLLVVWLLLLIAIIYYAKYIIWFVKEWMRENWLKFELSTI